MTKVMRAQVSLLPQYSMSALTLDLIADAARAPAGQDGAARGGARPFTKPGK